MVLSVVTKLEAGLQLEAGYLFNPASPVAPVSCLNFNLYRRRLRPYVMRLPKHGRQLINSAANGSAAAAAAARVRA